MSASLEDVIARLDELNVALSRAGGAAEVLLDQGEGVLKMEEANGVHRLHSELDTMERAMDALKLTLERRLEREEA